MHNIALMLYSTLTPLKQASQDIYANLSCDLLDYFQNLLEHV